MLEHRFDGAVSVVLQLLSLAGKLHVFEGAGGSGAPPPAGAMADEDDAEFEDVPLAGTPPNGFSEGEVRSFSVAATDNSSDTPLSGCDVKGSSTRGPLPSRRIDDAM